MLFKEWENYFKTLPVERLTEIVQAFEWLQADPEIEKSYHADFLDLKYLAIYERDKKLSLISQGG